MKAKHVIYSRLISKPNYENEKIEICIEVEEGEKLKDVFDAAKKFVDLKADSGKITGTDYDTYLKIGGHVFSLNSAQKVLADKDNHTGNQIKEAEEIVKRFEASEIDDLPF